MDSIVEPVSLAARQVVRTVDAEVCAIERKRSEAMSWILSLQGHRSTNMRLK